MIISVLRGSEDFVHNPKDYKVTLDGVEQTQCITADEEGTILRYKVNKFGLRCKGRNNKFETETVKGNVVIRLLWSRK